MTLHQENKTTNDLTEKASTSSDLTTEGDGVLVFDDCGTRIRISKATLNKLNPENCAPETNAAAKCPSLSTLFIDEPGGTRIRVTDSGEQAINTEVRDPIAERFPPSLPSLADYKDQKK